MVRVKLVIEYNGAPFAGWQRQPDRLTVQSALETAAAKLDGEPVVVRGAGRTDAGVHARGQVADMDLMTARPIREVADAMNYHLRPLPVAVLSAEVAADNFSARFDAVGRAYRYLIVNRRADLALQRGLVWRVPQRLDEGVMARAAEVVLGEHDFTTFRDLACQATSPVRTIDKIEVVRRGEMIEIRVEARSFLHRQVRSIVGSMAEIGRDHRPLDWMSEILEGRDRRLCGAVAPGEGLYLERVEYG